jgi:hypothetical protein
MLSMQAPVLWTPRFTAREGRRIGQDSEFLLGNPRLATGDGVGGMEALTSRRAYFFERYGKTSISKIKEGLQPWKLPSNIKTFFGKLEETKEGKTLLLG